MIKMVVPVYRRPDLTLEQFEDYWRNKHAPLVKTLASAFRFKKYVQSYDLPSPEISEFVRSRGWSSPPDALTEVWWESEEEMRAAFASPEGQEASRIAAEDEAKFVDMTRVTAFLTTEYVVFDYTTPGN